METKDTLCKCQEEIGNNQQETIPTTKDGLTLSLKTNMDNGSTPRFNANLTINSKTSMDTSKGIKEIITITKAATNHITQTITKAATNQITTNSYHKVTGSILLETILTKMDG